jgi:hypothetical protein
MAWYTLQGKRCGVQRKWMLVKGEETNEKGYQRMRQRVPLRYE